MIVGSRNKVIVGSSFIRSICHLRKRALHVHLFNQVHLCESNDFPMKWERARLKHAVEGP